MTDFGAFLIFLTGVGVGYAVRHLISVRIHMGMGRRLYR
jgi:hypothetical protein